MSFAKQINLSRSKGKEWTRLRCSERNGLSIMRDMASIPDSWIVTIYEFRRKPETFQLWLRVHILLFCPADINILWCLCPESQFLLKTENIIYDGWLRWYFIKVSFPSITRDYFADTAWIVDTAVPAIYIKQILQQLLCKKSPAWYTGKILQKYILFVNI